jgi:hypothetical protein
VLFLLVKVSIVWSMSESLNFSYTLFLQNIRSALRHLSQTNRMCY